MNARHCPICGDEIPATAHRLKKLCGKKECLLEQQRISGRKSYHKLLGHTEPEKRSCVVCSADISHLRGNRVVCENPACKETIVKRTKNEYYERNHGTLTDVERRRQASRVYRAKHQPWKKLAAARPPKPPKVAKDPKPVRPKLNANYQRKPKASYKPIIRRRVVRPIVVEDDTPWIPKPFNLPEERPVIHGIEKREISSFPDPWNCFACRTAGELCKLHTEMEVAGYQPRAVS